jgi:hypothetical protein
LTREQKRKQVHFEQILFMEHTHETIFLIQPQLDTASFVVLVRTTPSPVEKIGALNSEVLITGRFINSFKNTCYRVNNMYSKQIRLYDDC